MGILCGDLQFLSQTKWATHTLGWSFETPRTEVRGLPDISFKCYGIKQSVNHTIFVFIYGKEELLGFLKMGEKLCRLRSGVSHLIVIILKRINLYNCP